MTEFLSLFGGFVLILVGLFFVIPLFSLCLDWWKANESRTINND